MESSIFFKTENKNLYLYDFNNKELLNVHPIILDIHNFFTKNTLSEKELDVLKNKYSKSVDEIDYYIKKYHFLLEKGFFCNIETAKYLSGRINRHIVDINISNCNNLVFQVTNKCNLKCTYCCYGDLYENYSPEKPSVMDFNTAKVLIDYLKDKWNSEYNISSSNTIVVGFYGGEPLLNFSLIEKIVNYIKGIKLNNNQKFEFAITTNAVLLNKYIDFLFSNNFSLLISLDGDKKSNSYRLYKNNTQSFERVFKNVKMIQNKYPDYFNTRVRFNSVLNSNSNIDFIESFFKNEFNKSTNIEAISVTGLKSTKLDKFASIYQKTTKRDNSFYVKNIGYFFYYHLSNSYKHYTELLSKQSNNKIRIPTGTCLPFSRKIYLTPVGDILACERIGQNTILGRIKDDQVFINTKDISKKYNKLYSDIQDQCNNCFYSTFCSVCIFQLPLVDGKYYCDIQYNLNDLLNYLNHQISFLENNPHLFKSINQTLFA